MQVAERGRVQPGGLRLQDRAAVQAAVIPPRTAHVQETTAMRNGLAALPLEDRVSYVIPRWAELSAASFTALVPTP